jgi:hypothetical protein
MTHIDWIFLSELLVIPGTWVLACAWNNHFNNKKQIEHAAHINIVQKYLNNITNDPSL